MTDKQIIIDGVDVKDCKRRIGKDNFCRYYKRPCTENNYNCIWKKYLRKEQECERLKWYMQEIRNQELFYLDIEWDEYETHCIDTEYSNIINLVEEALEERSPEDLDIEKDKTMNEFNFKSYDTSRQSISYCEVDKCKAVIKLKKCLQEIREIAEKTINSSDCYERMYGGMCARPILQKISEVENG